nr:pentatricopeptide repeat-containing protein [Tanacetum cinerariifolium]
MLVEMYVSYGKMGDAMRVFDEMSVAVNGRVREALGIFCEMLDDGVDGDEGTVVSILPVCARLGEDDRGRLDGAFLVFEDMSAKIVVSWNALISDLAFNGNGVKGLALFDEMVKKVLKPNDKISVDEAKCCVMGLSSCRDHGYMEIAEVAMENEDVDQQLGDEDRRIVLTIQGGLFNPSNNVTSTITSIWKSRFTGAWDNWTIRRR